ncbi:MAG: cyclic nucleotide-binding domain-containing protein [Bacteroidetes bacterium]|nr:MAG: cyclic nucleotide-binding domain-containing protein [Bacteroidota bacterium]
MISNASIKSLLQEVEIFKGIPAELIDAFSNRLESSFYRAGTELIHKGDEGNSMFVIAEGIVKIHDGEHVIAKMAAGNFFGEFSLLDEAPRSMSVSAEGDIRVIKISRELFFELLQSQPEVAKKIISGLTRRLRNQNESIIRQLKSREEELTRLVDERTRELKLRNEEISIKNREITDNVNYAKRIQTAILPDTNAIQKAFNESFILYLPKDIVSGDFYAFFPKQDSAIIIAADCTGHGVTGAFLSVVGNSLLTQIINEKKVSDPGKILDQLNEAVIDTLNQRQGESTDGMDISICSLNFKTKKLKFSGANRPLWIIRNNELSSYTANKFPVGGMQILHEENFQSHEIQMEKGDTFYIFSDGYADQFGGESGKKFMTKKLKEVLLSIQKLSMKEQQVFLLDAFNKWRGDQEQVDDVLVIGVKI